MKEGIAVLLLFFNKVETTGLVLERILEQSQVYCYWHRTEPEKIVLMMRRQFRNAEKE